MAQQGTVTRKGPSWYLTYRDNFLIDGKMVRKQVVKKLADVCDRYRRESDLADLVREKLDAAQAVSTCPQSASGFNQYFTDVYVPSITHAKRPKAASTIACYKEYHRRYIAPRAEGFELRDFSVKVVCDLLESCASMHKLNTATCRKIQSIMSAVFHLAAKRGDVPKGFANPARGEMIPDSASDPKETACPSAEQFQAMLDQLDALPLEKAAVALIGECGMRPGEARAIRWEDYDLKELTLRVSRSRWHTVEGPTKTKSNKLVPVTPLLAEILAALRKSRINPTGGRMLTRPDGKACNLDNMSKRTIRPALTVCATCGKSQLAEHTGHTFQRDAKASIEWPGFYSLRRLHGTRVYENSDMDTVASFPAKQ